MEQKEVTKKKRIRATWTQVRELENTIKEQQEIIEKMKALFEEAVRNRIKQLFDEHVIVEGELAEAGYISILNVFAVGYQLGWNDHCEFR